MEYKKPNGLQIGSALKTALQKRKMGKENAENSTKYFDGKKVVLSTVITLRSKEEGKPAKKFREYVFEDGTIRRELIGEVKNPDYIIDQEAGIHRLSPQEYDIQKKRWRPVDALQRENASFDRVYGHEIRVITYNVWFSEVNRRPRCNALLEILEEKDPDIICLQEVTPFFLSILTQNEWIRSTFMLSDAVGTTLRGSAFQYGVVMLIRKVHCKDVSMTLYTIPSNMNRRPLVATIVSDSFRLQVATMHLESMNSTQLRRIQQEKIFSILDENTPDVETFSIFCGDFNYNADAQTEEAKVVPPEYNDAWTSVYGDSTSHDSFTFPGIGRIDRILYKSTRDQHRCKQIEHLGTTPIQGLVQESNISEARPSDHFGLCAVFYV